MCEYVMATVFCLEVEGPLPADVNYCKFEWISERTPGSLILVSFDQLSVHASALVAPTKQRYHLAI